MKHVSPTTKQAKDSTETNSSFAVAGLSHTNTKRSGVIAATLLSALTLAACGTATVASSAPASNTTAKTVSIHLWESHNGGPVGGAMTALVDQFNASHPTVHVTIVVTKASSKLIAATAAGDPPTLAEISHYDGKLVKAGALVPWNSYMNTSSIVTQSNLYPVVWKNGEVSGQHYRIMAGVKISEVFYNEALFQKAGITAPPTTDAQLASDAAKIQALGVTAIGWKDSSAHILPTFLSNGGTLLAHSNSIGHSVNFTSPAATATFSFFRSLYAANELQFHHGTTLREDLAAGKLAMIDGTSAGYQKVLDAVGGKFPVGAFVEPAGSTGKPANLAQGLGFVLPKGHSKAQDQAAFTFVQWFLAGPQQAYWSEHTGYAPETVSGASAIPASFLSGHPGLQASLAAVASPQTVARPVSDSYNEVQAVLDTAFFNAVTGKQTVAAALATLQSQGNSYMSGASEL